ERTQAYTNNRVHGFSITLTLLSRGARGTTMSFDLPHQITACRSRIALVRALIDAASSRGEEAFEAEQALRLEGELLHGLELQRLEELFWRGERLGSSAELGMRARQPISGTAFGPDALKVIGEAFDAAWAEIEGNFGNVPVDIDIVRYRLATALLSVASEGSRDVKVLQRAALQRMALDHGTPG